MMRRLKILAATLAVLAPAAVLGAPSIIEGFASFFVGKPAPSTLTGSEVLPLAQNGATTAMTLTRLGAYVAGLVTPSSIGALAPTGSGSQLTGITATQTGAATPSVVSTAVANLQTYLLGFLQQNYTLQVSSAGALRGLVGFPGVTVHRSGFYVAGDGGAADYAFNAATCGNDDGGSCLNALGGGSWRIDWGSVGNVAPSPVFGTICTGNGAYITNDTNGINAALATGRKVLVPMNNFCVIGAPLVFSSTAGQQLIGQGAQATKFLIYNVFGAQTNGAYTQGVFTLSASEQEIDGIGMSFQQPKSRSDGATLTRADLITYPPAIMARQTATKLKNIRIAGATTCIDMGGNTNAGNSKLMFIDTGCFDYGIRLDGSLDTVSIHAHHHFAFDMNMPQQNIFIRPQNIAIDLGRMDHCTVTASFELGTTAFNFYNGAQGGAFCTVTGYDFDGGSPGILMQTPNASFVGSALSFSMGNDSQSAIIQTAGKIAISGSSFFEGAPTTVVSMSGGILNLSGNEFNQGSNDSEVIDENCPTNGNAPTVNSNAASNCRVSLTGNIIERDATVVNNPWLKSKGFAVFSVTGNTVTAGNSGPSMSFDKDTNGNRVFANSSVGRSSFVAGSGMASSLTATSGGGIYAGN